MGWARAYSPAVLRADLGAGVLLAGYLVPVSLAYAGLAQLPPQAGLYASMVAGLGFALFTSGRHTAIGVTSSISLMMAAALEEMAGGDPARQLAIASMTALYVGVLAVIARLARAGAVVAFISETLLVGFKLGVAFHIAVSQLPKLFGVSGGKGHFVEKVTHLVGSLGSTHLPTFLLGVACLAVLWLGKRFLPGRPVALALMVLALLLMGHTALGEQGIRTMGALPEGLPQVGPPPVRGRDVDGLFGLALACFLLGTVETMAVGRSFGMKHGYRVEPDREFLALAGANLLAGLVQGYPVSGGMSQSAVNESSGAKTPASLIVACVLVGLVATVAGGLLADLPDAMLAALVLMAVAGLVDVHALRRIWRHSRREFLVTAVAALGVLGLGVLQGVLLAAVASLLLLITRAMSPQLRVLGQLPGGGAYVGLDRASAARPVAGAHLLRPYGAILYFNADTLRGRVLESWQEAGRPRVLLLDLGAVPLIDLEGADTLARLRAEVAAHGGELRLAETRSAARAALAHAHPDAGPWPGDPGAPIADVLAPRA